MSEEYKIEQFKDWVGRTIDAGKFLMEIYEYFFKKGSMYEEKFSTYLKRISKELK